jgi:microcystin-dependent protein
MPESRNMTQVQPPGMISYFGNSSAPDGWLLCNGAAVSRSTYSDLFAAIGTTFGAGNGSTTFTLPDLRGEFLRGWDNARGIDSHNGVQPRSFASFQKGSLQAYNVPNNEGGVGGYSISNTNDAATGTRDAGVDWVTQGSYDPTGSIHSNTGPLNTGDWINDEGWGGGGQRPRNVALLICIKF